jgi:hypothetical protein
MPATVKPTLADAIEVLKRVLPRWGTYDLRDDPVFMSDVKEFTEALEQLSAPKDSDPTKSLSGKQQESTSSPANLDLAHRIGSLAAFKATLVTPESYRILSKRFSRLFQLLEKHYEDRETVEECAKVVYQDAKSRGIDYRPLMQVAFWPKAWKEALQVVLETEVRTEASTPSAATIAPDGTARTASQIDRCSLGIAILGTAKIHDKKMTVEQLAREMGVRRTALYANLEFESVRTAARSLFGLFQKPDK